MIWGKILIFLLPKLFYWWKFEVLSRQRRSQSCGNRVSETQKIISEIIFRKLLRINSVNFFWQSCFLFTAEVWGVVEPTEATTEKRGQSKQRRNCWRILQQRKHTLELGSGKHCNNCDCCLFIVREAHPPPPPHRALDTGQFRFRSKFKVPSCVQKWPS